jgi:hypothetical protein
LIQQQQQLGNDASTPGRQRTGTPTARKKTTDTKSSTDESPHFWHSNMVSLHCTHSCCSPESSLVDQDKLGQLLDFPDDMAMDVTGCDTTPVPLENSAGLQGKGTLTSCDSMDEFMAAFSDSDEFVKADLGIPPPQTIPETMENKENKGISGKYSHFSATKNLSHLDTFQPVHAGSGGYFTVVEKPDIGCHNSSASLNTMMMQSSILQHTGGELSGGNTPIQKKLSAIEGMMQLSSVTAGPGGADRPTTGEPIVPLLDQSMGMQSKTTLQNKIALPFDQSSLPSYMRLPSIRTVTSKDLANPFRASLPSALITSYNSSFGPAASSAAAEGSSAEMYSPVPGMELESNATLDAKALDRRTKDFLLHQQQVKHLLNQQSLHRKMTSPTG